MWSIRRNIAVVGLTGLADGVGLMAAFVVIARALGPAAYGQFSAAYALVMLISVMAEGGLGATVTRGVARDRLAAGAYVGHALALRVLLVAAVWGVSVALAQAAFADERVRIVAILGAYAALASISQIGDALFRAHERMDLALRSVVVERATLLLGLGALAIGGLSLDGAAMAVTLSGAARLLAVVGPVARLAGAPILQVDLTAWSRLMREALPIGMTSAMVSVSWRVDTVMLAVLLPGSAAVVGTYNAAYTVFSAMLLPAGAIAISLFPVVSRLYASSPAQVRALCGRAAAWLAAIGVLATIGLYVAAGGLTQAIYGAPFQVSVPVLKVLAGALLVTYGAVFVRTVLPAIDCAWQAGLIVAVGALANVALDLLLIPRFAAIGAAWSTVASAALTASVGAAVLARHLRRMSRDAGCNARAFVQLEQPAAGAANKP